MLAASGLHEAGKIIDVAHYDFVGKQLHPALVDEMVDHLAALLRRDTRPMSHVIHGRIELHRLHLGSVHRLMLGKHEEYVGDFGFHIVEGQDLEFPLLIAVSGDKPSMWLEGEVRALTDRAKSLFS